MAERVDRALPHGIETRAGRGHAAHAQAAAVELLGCDRVGQGGDAQALEVVRALDRRDEVLRWMTPGTWVPW